jgi:hypothetical protein
MPIATTLPDDVEACECGNKRGFETKAPCQEGQQITFSLKKEKQAKEVDEPAPKKGDGQSGANGPSPPSACDSPADTQALETALETGTTNQGGTQPQSSGQIAEQEQIRIIVHVEGKSCTLKLIPRTDNDELTGKAARALQMNMEGRYETKMISGLGKACRYRKGHGTAHDVHIGSRQAAESCRQSHRGGIGLRN